MLISSAIFTITAQETTFGAKFGVNLSNYYGDDVNDSDSKTHIFGGFTADISLTDNFSIEPGVMFSFEGNKDVDVNYLRVPLLAKYYVIEGLSLNFGPNLGFAVSSETSEGVSLTDVTKTVDVDLQFGASYLFDNSLSVSLGYNHGLTDVFDNGIDYKTSVWQLSIGYRFK